MITRTRSYPVDALDPKVKHYSRMNFNLADLEAADVDPEGWPIWSETVGLDIVDQMARFDRGQEGISRYLSSSSWMRSAPSP